MRDSVDRCDDVTGQLLLPSYVPGDRPNRIDAAENLGFHLSKALRISDPRRVPSGGPWTGWRLCFCAAQRVGGQTQARCRGNPDPVTRPSTDERPPEPFEGVSNRPGGVQTALNVRRLRFSL